MRNDENNLKEEYKANPKDESLFNNLCEAYILRGRFDEFIELTVSYYNAIGEEEFNKRKSYLKRWEDYSNVIKTYYSYMNVEQLQKFVDEMDRQLDNIKSRRRKFAGKIVLSDKLLNIAEELGYKKESEMANVFIEAAQKINKSQFMKKKDFTRTLAIKEIGFLEENKISEVLIDPIYETLNIDRTANRNQQKWIETMLKVNEYYIQNREVFNKEIKFILAECPNVKKLMKEVFSILDKYYERSASLFDSIDRAMNDERVIAKCLLDGVKLEIFVKVMIIDHEPMQRLEAKFNEDASKVEIVDLEETIKIIKNEYSDLYKTGKKVFDQIEQLIDQVVKIHGPWVRNRNDGKQVEKEVAGTKHSSDE